MKTCSRCKVEKPLDQFSADRRRRDGKQYTCKPCQRDFQREYRAAHRAGGELTYSQRNYRRLRKEVLDAYSNNDPKCACCGERTFEFLSLDHINGGGRQHRAAIGLQRTHFYRWIKNNKYPDGFRVLCHNCNQALGNFGYCPHGPQEVRAA